MVEIYDIETYNEAFIVCSLDRDTLEENTFEVSFRRDDSLRLIEHLEEVKGQIGYNNLNFDYPIIHWFLNHHMEYDQFTLPQAICAKAQEVIDQEYSAIWDRYIKIPQLDLFKIWHFDNKNKSTNLKYLEFAMRMDNIEDLPYGIYDNLTEEMIDNLIKYCHHDVKATYEFYKITIGDTDNVLYKGKDKISFRKTMGKKFNTNFINANDVKIGEEINKLTYLKLSGKEWGDIKDKKTNRGLISIKNLIPNYIQFSNNPLQDLLDYISNESINCYNPKLEYIFEFADKTWKFALGGIHTEDKPGITIPNKDQNFEEADVSSMYPNKITTRNLYPAHLGKEWLVGYEDNKNKRIELKHKKDKTPTDIQEVEVRKLSMNGGGFGKTGEETNWQYDPLVKYTTTIQCQLDILLLADMLWQSKLIDKIESGNTDGINVLYNKINEEKVHNIYKEWESITNAELEITPYTKIIRTSVNDYMAFKTNDKIKLKGDFEIDKELHKNHSQQIVPIAIYKYYTEGILPEITIRNHRDIFDFCKAVKGIKDATFIDRYWDGNKFVDIPLQKRVNRYIVSTKGNKLIKILPPLVNEDGTLKKDKLAKYRQENPKQLDLFHFVEDPIIIKDREFEVEAGYYTTIMNRIGSKEVDNYDIDYNYYINECYKIINQIQ